MNNTLMILLLTISSQAFASTPQEKERREPKKKDWHAIDMDNPDSTERVFPGVVLANEERPVYTPKLNSPYELLHGKSPLYSSGAASYSVLMQHTVRHQFWPHLLNQVDTQVEQQKKIFEELQKTNALLTQLIALQRNQVTNQTIAQSTLSPLTATAFLVPPAQPLPQTAAATTHNMPAPSAPSATSNATN